MEERTIWLILTVVFIALAFLGATWLHIEPKYPERHDCEISACAAASATDFSDSIYCPGCNSLWRAGMCLLWLGVLGFVVTYGMLLLTLLAGRGAFDQLLI